MKLGTLRAVGHNIADSLASGIGLMIGVYEMYVFKEAANSPEGYIEVDFLDGTTSGAKPSATLQRAIKLYSEALPDLCRRHNFDVSEFAHLTARYSGGSLLEEFTVNVSDSKGRSSQDRYVGVPGRRPRILNHLGRLRRA